MGDSLTAGTLSANWVAALVGDAQGWALVNVGYNGQVRRADDLSNRAMRLLHVDQVGCRPMRSC